MTVSSVWNRCKQIVISARWLTLGQIVAVFALGVAVHWLLSPAEKGVHATPQKAGVQKSDADTQTWTCSMHPQIQKDGPGDCPICGMDLIPVTTGKTMGLRFLPVTPEARELMNIEVMPAERRYVNADIRMVGKVEYDETRLKYITAWVPGRLDRLFVNYTGVQVKEGDHMVKIYSEELYSAQQELIEAKRTDEKPVGQRTILDSDSVNLLESAREKLRLLGLTKEQITDIEQRNKPSVHMTIYAPMGGTVVEKLRQEGDRVQVGERIYAIADLTHLWVMLDAYESDLEWIRYGQKVEITTEAYPGMTPLEGQIAFIQPVLNEKTRTVKVRVNVENKNGLLKPQMFVRSVVRAKVAGKGRVIDPGLAGKWISPMHPEIVKDKPGKCPVCGMALVKAESLGYVVPGEDKIPPLVIPASAVLKTGTRAVVYVELPQFRRTILDTYRHVTDAMAHGTLDEIRKTFAELQSVLEEPNTLLRTRYARRLWKKYAGRVRKEAVHGANASNKRDVQEAFNGTKTALDRLREHFAPADRPTFAGRQIVLGPRAGDYYLVRHGLAAGELVVTQGNFKIDSALQIQASPSMMTPQGGGGGGGHDHGGQGTATQTTEDPGAQATGDNGMYLPITMRRTLHHILAVSESIGELLEQEKLQTAKEAFARIGRLLRGIDDDTVEGHARLVWKELKMLLENDAVEGSQVQRLPEARRVFAGLQQRLQRVDRQFGLSHGDSGPKRYDVSPEFQNQLAGLWKAYTGMAEALANDNPQAAAEHIAKFQSALRQVDMKLLSDLQAHAAWMRAQKTLQSTIAELSKTQALKSQRTLFKSLSSVMQGLALSFGFGEETPVYRHYCNMAFGKNKGASWLQPNEKTHNPYLGSAMPRCAQQVDLIAGKQDKPLKRHKSSPKNR